MIKRDCFLSKFFSFFLVILLTASILLACAPKEAPKPVAPTPGAPETTAPSAPVQKIAWRANAIIPKGQSMPSRAPYDDLMRKIIERTGGRLEIQSHWIGELGFGARDWPKLVKEGLVEVNDLPFLMGSSYIPELGYESVSLHLGAPPDPDRTVAVHQGRRLVYDEILAEWGGKRLASFYLVPTVNAPAEMATPQPYRSLAEMKSKVRRVMAPEEAAFWANFGLKAVLIPPYEQYMALKTGLIDISSHGRGSYKDYRLMEVAKYLIVWYPGRTSLTAWGWAVSNLYWAKLPPDIQKVMVDAYKEYQDEIDSISGSKFVPPDDEEVNKMIKDYGVTIIELPREDVAAIVAVADRETAKWLVKTNDRGRRLYLSDMKALGRPERYEELLKLGKELTK